MKALGALLLLELLGQAWCCCPMPGDTNIARGGEASQSSIYSSAQNLLSRPENAIDGVSDTDWNKGSCAITNYDMEPWWTLDLKQRYKVTVVVVTGRGDCCPDRIEGIEVRIGDSSDNNNPVCANVTNGFDLRTIFWCKGMEGQYVSVVIPKRTEYLSLCEVEVYSVTEEGDCW